MKIKQNSTIILVVMAKKKQTVKGELIYGINPILELLKAKRRKIIQLYTTRPEPRSMGHIKRYLPRHPVPIQYVTRAILQRMVDNTDHQGVVAWVHPFPFTKKLFDPAKHPFILMLDGVQDTRNFGAILRSAYCTGIDAIVVPTKNSAPLNATTLKASAGLAEQLQINITDNLLATAHELKKAGYKFVLATLDGQDPETLAFDEPTCLVIGSEGTGISTPLLSLGTHITIPQRSPDISYNASVAAGILLYTIGRKKKIL